MTISFINDERDLKIGQALPVFKVVFLIGGLEGHERGEPAYFVVGILL